MNPLQAFDKAASTYSRHSHLQQKIAHELLQNIPVSPNSVLDIGCGDGVVYRNLPWVVDHFYALDGSSSMLKFHPEDDHIHKIHLDFDHLQHFEREAELALSSSSLQWSNDLDSLLQKITRIAPKGAFAIFTNRSMRELHQAVNFISPLRNKTALLQVFSKHYDFHHELETYQLEFDSRKELLGYIRHSGISGKSSSSNIKALIRYAKEKKPAHLTFEVLYVWGKRKND